MLRNNDTQQLFAVQQPITILVLNVQNRYTVYVIIRLIGEPTCLTSHTKESRPPPSPPSPPNLRSVDLSKSFRNFTGLKPYASPLPIQCCDSVTWGAGIFLLGGGVYQIHPIV